MREEENGILNNIKSVYGNLTTLEKEIADFFLNGPDIKDFQHKMWPLICLFRRRR